nr:hypothetical protein [Candidatus Omnitrophota bacterium]
MLQKRLVFTLLVAAGIVVMSAFFSMTYASNVIYDAGRGQAATDTSDGTAAVDDALPPKGAVYDMGSDLINARLFVIGEHLTRERIIELRQKTNNPATGKPWSESTIDREIASFLKMDLLRKDPGGGFIVTKTINRPQWNSILKATRQIQGLEQGLRRYTVADLPDGIIDQIKTTIEQVFQVRSSNPLDHAAQDKTITTADRIILENKVEVTRIEDFIQKGFTILIATSVDVGEDLEYLNRITSAFSDPDLIKRLIQEQVIIFSRVDADSGIFAAIEANIAKDAASRTVNNLTQEQQAALKSGV